MFKPFTDEQLADFEDRFGAIETYTPDPRPRKFRKPGAEPEPPFSLVFRPATPDEWVMIQKQGNNEAIKHRAPYNLAKATVVAVSLDGVHIIHAGEPGSPPNDSAASKAPREAYDRVTKIPGYAAVSEDVADKLARLNGINAAASEKG